MSRRNNKAATQAETADLVPALSEAASSSSSSAPIHATRGAFAALLAKEINQVQGWDSVPFFRLRHSRFLTRQQCVLN